MPRLARIALIPLLLMGTMSVASAEEITPASFTCLPFSKDCPEPPKNVCIPVGRTWACTNEARSQLTDLPHASSAA